MKKIFTFLIVTFLLGGVGYLVMEKMREGKVGAQGNRHEHGQGTPGGRSQ